MPYLGNFQGAKKIYTPPHPINLFNIGGPFLYTFCIRLCGNGGNLWGNTLFEGNNMYPLSSLHSLLLGDTPTVPSPESELLLFSGIYWKLIKLGSLNQLDS